MHVERLGKIGGNFSKSSMKNSNGGEMKFLHADNVVVVHWFDKRDVYAVSTIHGTDKSEVQRRGNQEPIDKPNMIVEYNKYMSGVDRCDQYLYNIGRPSNGGRSVLWAF